MFRQVDPQFQANWEENYEDHDVFPVQKKNLLVLNGYDIIKTKITHTQNIKFDHVILIYFQKIWDNVLSY